MKEFMEKNGFKYSFHGSHRRQGVLPGAISCT